MPSIPATAPLLLRAQFALGLSQREFGELLGVSRKTIGRWNGSTQLVGDQTAALARALYPVDPALAGEVARAGHQTLETLGIVPPPPPPAPPAPAPPPRPTPALSHLVDAVVMAATETFGELSPKLRPVLLAAFERAQAMGLAVDDVVRGLKAQPGPAATGEPEA